MTPAELRISRLRHAADVIEFAIAIHDAPVLPPLSESWLTRLLADCRECAQHLEEQEAIRSKYDG